MSSFQQKITRHTNILKGNTHTQLEETEQTSEMDSEVSDHEFKTEIINKLRAVMERAQNVQGRWVM